MYYLRALEYRDRRLESYSEHMFVFLSVFVTSYIWKDFAMGRPLSKKSYQISVRTILSEIKPIYLWLYSPLLDLDRFFSFLICTKAAGLLGRGISPSQRHYLHRTTQTENKRIQTSMRWVGFQPTIPVFKRAKTLHALDRTATLISRN
jgi:hypothetical protein